MLGLINVLRKGQHLFNEISKKHKLSNYISKDHTLSFPYYDLHQVLFYMSDKEFDEMNKNEIEDKIKQKDISMYEEALETVEKIQFGKELDSWDSCNLQYTIEDLLRFIIERLKNESSST